MNNTIDDTFVVLFRFIKKPISWHQIVAMFYSWLHLSDNVLSCQPLQECWRWINCLCCAGLVLALNKLLELYVGNFIFYFFPHKFSAKILISTSTEHSILINPPAYILSIHIFFFYNIWRNLFFFSFWWFSKLNVKLPPISI